MNEQPTPANPARRLRRAVAATSLGLSVLAMVSGCGPAPEEASAEGERAATATEQTEPATRTEFRIPADNFRADAGQGQALFSRHCATCHGPDALGTDQGPPLIHRIYEPSHHSDLAFYRAIALGVHQHHWEFGDMAPVPGVDGEDAAHIISWIRREQRAAGIE